MTESVSGLSVDATVKYRGVEVGRVREIVLNPENMEQVRLTLDIVRGTPIKEDTLAVLDTQGLTGLATVNLTGGSRDSPMLSAKPGEEYPVIQSGPSLFFRLDRALSRLLADESVPRLLENLDSLTRDARGAVDEENRAALRRLLGDFAKIAHTLAARREELDESVLRASEALGSFAGVGKKIDDQLPEVLNETRTSIRAFHEMTREMARTSASIESVLNGNRSNIEQFSGQTLGEAAVLISELRELTARLGRLAQELEQEPSTLIFGRPRLPRGPGE
jgi:phospholipid/cholesterol/gamma-HCH transport system substrate-binding protein